MKGEAAPAKESFTRYLQSYPGGAFSLNAHYYLCVIGKEQKNYDMRRYWNMPENCWNTRKIF